MTGRIPFTKNGVRVELLAGDDVEVRIMAEGRSHIATVDMSEYDTPAEMIVAALTDYIATSLPFGHNDVTALAELRAMMADHIRNGLPFRKMLAAGWQFPE